MDVHVSFDWHRLGAVTWAAGKPSFPSIPAKPGVWRITVGSHAHHGSAQNLRTATYMLAAPGPTQATNRRVHDAIMEGLGAGQPVVIDIIAAARSGPSRRLAPLDLTDDDARALVKAAAVHAHDPDPDPASVEYRGAHATLRDSLVQFTACDLMLPLIEGRPNQPRSEDVRLMRQTAEALHAFIAEHDRYWPTRWGRDGNPTR